MPNTSLNQRHLGIGPITIRLDYSLPDSEQAQLSTLLDPFTIAPAKADTALEMHADHTEMLHRHLVDVPVVSPDHLVWPAIELWRRPDGWYGESIATTDPILLGVRWVLGNQLLQHGGLLLHASSVLCNGFGHVFLGTSGAGKTTIAIESDVDGIFSDEASIIAPDADNRWLVWPSPFWGTDIVGRPTEPAPIGALWILGDWGDTRITSQALSEAALQIIHRAFDIQAIEGAYERVLEIISQLIATVPVRTLSWKRGDSLRALLKTPIERTGG